MFKFNKLATAFFSVFLASVNCFAETYNCSCSVSLQCISYNCGSETHPITFDSSAQELDSAATIACLQKGEKIAWDNGLKLRTTSYNNCYKTDGGGTIDFNSDWLNRRKSAQ